eukprot:13333432-Heterocapsa_arctica.AAC.1
MMPPEIGSFIKRAATTTISGVVDEINYVAAETGGDGACGLHAVFGDPINERGMLFCHQARATILTQVSDDVEEVCGLYDGALRDSFLDVLRQ